MRQDSTIHVVWFLAGVAFGVAAGMVMAPRSGADTRHYLATSGRELFDKGKQLADEASELFDEAADMIDEGRRMVEDAENTPRADAAEV